MKPQMIARECVLTALPLKESGRRGIDLAQASDYAIRIHERENVIN